MNTNLICSKVENKFKSDITIDDGGGDINQVHYNNWGKAIINIHNIIKVNNKSSFILHKKVDLVGEKNIGNLVSEKIQKSSNSNPSNYVEKPKSNNSKPQNYVEKPK